ncbi:hypothetical protein ACFX2A_012612 [Malus domestica]
MIASKPYAKKNGVSSISHLFVVRYAHRTQGSSSSHLPFLSERVFLRQLKMVLLDASACPLPCGYQGVDICCLMLYFFKNLAKSLPTNCGPLLVTMNCRIPKRQTMFFYMKRSMSVWVVVVMGSASSHFVK